MCLRVCLHIMCVAEDTLPTFSGFYLKSLCALNICVEQLLERKPGS